MACTTERIGGMVANRANKCLTWCLIWGVAVITVALVLAGCDGDGDEDLAPPTVNVSGTWSGSWLSDNGVDGGNVTFVSLSQIDSMVTGEVSFTGSPCFSGAALSGVISGETLTGSLRAGSIQVDVDATVTGDQMNGTYDTVNAGACTGDTGMFSATR